MPGLMPEGNKSYYNLDLSVRTPFMNRLMDNPPIEMTPVFSILVPDSSFLQVGVRLGTPLARR